MNKFQHHFFSGMQIFFGKRKFLYNKNLIEFSEIYAAAKSQYHLDAKCYNHFIVWLTSKTNPHNILDLCSVSGNFRKKF